MYKAPNLCDPWATIPDVRYLKVFQIQCSNMHVYNKTLCNSSCGCTPTHHELRLPWPPAFSETIQKLCVAQFLHQGQAMKLETGWVQKRERIGNGNGKWPTNCFLQPCIALTLRWLDLISVFVSGHRAAAIRLPGKHEWLCVLQLHQDNPVQATHTAWQGELDVPVTSQSLADCMQPACCVSQSR